MESGKWKVESENDSEIGNTINVTVQNVVTPTEKEIVIPINVQRAAGKDIIAYEFDLRYDPAVIQPMKLPVDLEGTVSRGLTAVVNAKEPGLLRVVVYGAYPINEDGVLLNLRFTAVGAVGSVSNFKFENLIFNEGEPMVVVNDGRIELF